MYKFKCTSTVTMKSRRQRSAHLDPGIQQILLSKSRLHNIFIIHTNHRQHHVYGQN